MPPAPELAMAIATDGPRVHVSGKAGVQVHDLAAGTSTSRSLPGEAKAMTLDPATMTVTPFVTA